MAEAYPRTLRVPAGHPVFSGHFPGRPIVPGVMLLEWVVEECARLRACAPSTLRVREAKFFTPLQPEQTAVLQLESGESRCTFSISYRKATIARGILEWDAN